MVSRKSKFLNSDKNKNLQHQWSKGLGASGSVSGDCQKLDCVDRFQLHSLPDHTVLGNIFLSFREYINKFNYLETTNNLGFPFLRSIFDRLFRKWFLSASAKLLKIILMIIIIIYISHDVLSSCSRIWRFRNFSLFQDLLSAVQLSPKGNSWKNMNPRNIIDFLAVRNKTKLEKKAGPNMHILFIPFSKSMFYYFNITVLMILRMFKLLFWKDLNTSLENKKPNST